LITKIKSKNLFKYKIFRDLWQRGLIVTCGIKFGATYLIYAGEISIVHASSSVILMEPTDYIYPHEIISFGRVGTTTKKRCLLANISSNLLIVYIGLKWNNDLP
jgi:tRNA-intron lyase